MTLCSCVDHDRLVSMVTPRYLYDSTRAIGVSLRRRSIGWDILSFWCDPITMYFVLCTLRPRPLAWIQFEMDARSLFSRSSISIVLLMLKYKAVSSANILILQLFTHSGSIWRSMKVYESMLRYMKGYESIWRSMKCIEEYEGIWRSMKGYEGIWRSTKEYEGVWRGMKEYEGLWRRMKVYEWCVKVHEGV